jgi:phosphoserine aminotransferase
LREKGRWAPATLDFLLALENSRLDQTYNTPALATLFLLADQVDWMLEQGGLEWTAARCRQSAAAIYGWADTSSFAQPFVTDARDRSPVVATIDLDAAVNADTMSGVLRANGIVDTESYRKLGRNQLRIALFPAIEPADVEALIACIDYVASALG